MYAPTFKSERLNVKYFSAFNMATNEMIWLSRFRSPQHFYPLTAKDYCEAVKYAALHGIDQMPIVSISAKDFPFCDFNCIDCLATPSRKWAIADQHIKFPIIPIEKYKSILKEISTYSKERGCDSVRFEICGEGNPDLYSNRIEMLEYAKQECNMGLVYVSTGSRISDDLLKALVENVDFIRISFPGINENSYKVYSNQNHGDRDFSYIDALHLLDKLCNTSAKLGMEDSLLIGTRTCIRPLNAGCYHDFIRTIASIGVDVFQGVKVLIPDFESFKDEHISKKEVEELISLQEVAYSYGIKDFQIPSDLNTVYKNRSLSCETKPTICWSSRISPPMYGTNLMSCVLWDKITNPNYHFGVMEGLGNELSKLMNGENAKFIMENCPKNCAECPSIKDNSFLESLWRALKLQGNIDNVKFITHY